MSYKYINIQDLMLIVQVPVSATMFEYPAPHYFPAFQSGPSVSFSQSEARFLQMLYWRYPIAEEIKKIILPRTQNRALFIAYYGQLTAHTVICTLQYSH